MKLQIELDIAEESIDKPRLEEHLRQEAILTLFAERKIPAGKAARDLGLERIDFMDLLQQRGIPYVVYTADDFEQDRTTIDRLRPEIERNLKESGAGRFK